MALSIIAYVSGHGFGHFTRSEPVLARVASRGVRVHLRTGGSALALARRARWAASLEEVDLGPGLVQRGPLDHDVAATAAVVTEHLAAMPSLIERESRAARALEATAIYGDVPPIAFEIAHAAGLPSIGLSNFSWSRIYASCSPALAFAARAAASSEARCTLHLDLPLSSGLESFPRREPIALIARPPTRSRPKARDLLPAPPDDPRPRVLVSFGGFGASLDLSEAASRNRDFRFVLFAASGALPENASVLPHDHALPHQDLVQGADAILGKLGYGTVAEALVAGTPFVHPTRGLPGEYDVLAAAVARHLPSVALSTEDLFAGRWSDALARALAARAAEPAPVSGGEAIASERVIALARGRL